MIPGLELAHGCAACLLPIIYIVIHDGSYALRTSTSERIDHVLSDQVLGLGFNIQVMIYEDEVRG